MDLLERSHRVERAPLEADEGRERSIEQITPRRQFQRELFGAALAIVILFLTWTLFEYHNVGGSPTQGFSQSSGIHNVWNSWVWNSWVWNSWVSNYWLVFPVGAVALIVGLRAWFVYGRKPTSDAEIAREMRRHQDEHQSLPLAPESDMFESRWGIHGVVA
jgi:hypothetical protein